MPRKQSGRNIFSVLNDFRARFDNPHPLTPTARRPIAPRRLAVESLEGRMMLSANPGASILGTAYNDLTGNGLTADDTHLQAVTINLFRDGGNGTFQGSAAGSDDTLIGTKQTDASGKYEFDNLSAGKYYVQEIVPAGYVVPLASGPVTPVVVSSAAALGVNLLTIDSFTTTQLTDASSLGSTTATSSVSAPGAIGGHRDMFVQLTSGVGDINLNANAFNQHLLEYNSSATGTGTRIVNWDGANSATPPTLNPTGLDHLDLTSGGTATGISLAIGADHDNGTATIRVYKDANDWSTLTVVVPNTGGTTSQAVILPFSSFTTGGGTGAGAFTDVGAIQLQLVAGAAFNGQVSLINTVGPTLLVTNLANYQPASVGDFVFWDLGKTGVQAPSDPAAANVTVQLLQNGSVVGTTTTNAQGAYHFTGLAPGAYSVKFVPTNGAIFTLQHQGANPAVDSDADPATGLAAFSLISGQNDTTEDAGLLPIDLSIAKAVNNPTPSVDSNVTFTITLNNAAGYSPATGVTVNDVLPAGLAFVSATPAAGTTYNSGTGVWNVGNLASGASTSLAIIATATTGGTKTNTAVVTASDEPDVGTVHQASATVTPPGSIGDLVFWDMGKTGIQAASDPGAANVTVQLFQGTSMVATTTTNAQGAYQFNALAPGVYSIKFIPPDASAFTLQDQGANPALDSDANPATGMTGNITLASGQNDTTQDAGLLPIDLSVTKAVNNPTPNVGSNVTFTITLNNAAGYSPATGAIVSDLLPAGLTFVSATAGAGTTYNSGTGVWTVGNLASGASANLTITATVTSGGTKTNIATVTASDEPDVGTIHQASASVTPPGSIGDLVFWDLGNNGIQTASDLGVANVTVQLLQGNTVVATTTTNAQGAYHFNGIAPGVYSEKFIPPNNAAFTLQHQGADPALDSDANPVTGTTSTFTLVSGQNDTTQDAGLLPIDLSVAKSVDEPAPLLGTDVTFTITVNNAVGFSPATGVKLSDVLPDGLTFVSATPAAGTTYNSGNGVWTIGNLASGDSTTLTIVATAATVGLKTNTALITTAGEPDIGTVLEASADVTPIPPHKSPPTFIDLSLSKTVDNPAPRLGTNVTFTITLSNAINVALATGVTVSDTLPAGMLFVSATPAAGTSYDSGTGVWTVGNLASGASTTLSITATVVTLGTKTNIADVETSDELDIGTDLEGTATVTPFTGLSKAMFLGR